MTDKKFRIHLLGLPHTKTTLDFTACAYTMKVWKFCKMMEGRGHHLMHYGHEESNPAADELISVISKQEWDAIYGEHDFKSSLFTYDTNDNAYQTFYRNAISEIRKRKQPGDIILPFWGAGVRPICDAHSDLITIEPGIGYAHGHWANYKIFESYAIYHAYCGLDSVGTCNQKWYDVVIPNYFDLDEFKYSDKKEDYFLFVGRVYDGKGLNIAIQATEAIGAKLKVAGQLSDHYADSNYKWPAHVEFVGYAGLNKRKELMKGAIASFLPSMYVEPFGGVQIENLLSGTPVITTDWGAFSENNIEGVTGYRCRTFEDFVSAATNCKNGKIKSIDCRNHGETFSLENIAPKYEKFFSRVTDIYGGKGWYTITDPSLYTKEWISQQNN
jgi:glycosyltransferase involved in cell wall biosynthesis|tara:strand:- start:787 stop:1941 length:1155 start_codon:yes stop_codon:yes gene_type:complete